MTVNGGPPALLRCDLKRAGVRISVGRSEKTRIGPLGAKAILASDNWSSTRTVRTGSSYLSLSEPILTFGLPADSAVTRWSVAWPDGKQVDGSGPLVPGMKLTAGAPRPPPREPR